MHTRLTDLDNRHFLLSIIGNSPIGKLVVDMNGYISVINHSAKEILGLNQDIQFYLNKNILKLDSMPDVLLNSLLGCMQVGREKFDLLEVSHLGKYLNIRGNETLNGMVITFEDITSTVISRIELEKKTEELSLRNEELLDFNHITSHDLQEPLKTIIGLSALLKDELVNVEGDTETYVSNINIVAQRMSLKISQLLDYAKLGGNSQKCEVDFNELVQKIVFDLQTVFDEKNIKVSFNNLPKIIGYDAELHSLLFNLVTNAIKFCSEERPLEIIINALDIGECFEFTIKDNGIGIESKYFDKIFQVFQRLHNSSDYPGTGLGLSVCKKIVEIHGGRIWVESTKGKGSEFKFVLKK